MKRIVDHKNGLYIVDQDRAKNSEPREAIETIKKAAKVQLAVTNNNVGDKFKQVTRYLIESDTCNKAITGVVKGTAARNRLYGPRKLAGKTKGLWAFLSGIDKTLHRHPASEVTQFLAHNGCNKSHLKDWIKEVGVLSASFCRSTKQNDWLDAMFDNTTTLPSVDTMLRQSGEFINGTGSTKWQRALYGSDYSKARSNKLLNPIVDAFGDPKEGLTVGMMAVSKLVLAHWVAEEFHPEFFSPHSFMEDTIDVYLYDEFTGWLTIERDNNGDQDVQSSRN